jgi:hypothetical protein
MAQAPSLLRSIVSVAMVVFLHAAAVDYAVYYTERA